MPKHALRAARDVASIRHYVSFPRLEDKIAKVVHIYCKGTKLEHFAARQAAADLCKVPGFVGGLADDKRPVSSRVGPGAYVGHFFEQKACGGTCANSSIPKELPYQEQTEKCEYGKVMKRLNFPHIQKGSQYKPASL